MSRLGFRGLMVLVSIALSITLSGCSGGGGSNGTSSGAPVPGTGAVSIPGPLRATDTNLVFVVTPDLVNNAGDINPATANLSNQGLQRALLLGRYLRTNLLNSVNPNAIHAMEPCTRLQTANNYPDVVPLQFMEQFALLNQYTLWQTPPVQDIIAASFPINVSYTAASLPAVAVPPSVYFPGCQGIDFADRAGGNEALVNGIITQHQSGFHVFAMPFVTLQSLLTNLKSLNAYGYEVPTAWQGPNTLYVLTVPAGSTTATLSAHDTHLEPGQAYPTPAIPYQAAPNQQTPFVIQPSTLGGSSIPAGINTNQTIYFVRHGEAHPTSQYEDGNMVMQGDWRALYLPGALAGKIAPPDLVYSVDPSQAGPGMPASRQSGTTFYSYVRPSMTVAPYAVAHDLPLCLASGVPCFGLTPAEDAAAVQDGVNFFFTGGRFSNKTLLVGWEHVHIQLIAQALVNRYFANPAQAPTVPAWPGDSDDYDTVWTFILDGAGNLTVNNTTCEGIKSSTLPSTAPQF